MSCTKRALNWMLALLFSVKIFKNTLFVIAGKTRIITQSSCCGFSFSLQANVERAVISTVKLSGSWQQKHQAWHFKLETLLHIFMTSHENRTLLAAAFKPCYSITNFDCFYVSSGVSDSLMLNSRALMQS